MARLELVSERPVFLDDILHKMRVIRKYGRPDEEIQVEVDDIRDYPDTHHTEGRHIAEGKFYGKVLTTNISVGRIL